MECNNSFENLLAGKFFDPIHGVIRVTKLEKKIIDHDLFQRLRGVRQNTFLYKVFPSAMHSRFEHSIGVMHLSYEILKNLDLNALIYERKKKDIDLFLDIKKLPVTLFQELRIAALLHDVGHGPLAHQFDDFAITKDEFEQKCDSDEKSKYHKILALSNKEKLTHEQVSCIFIIKIIEDLKNNSIHDDDEIYKSNIDAINAESIIKIVEKKYKFESKEISPNIYPLLCSIVSSSPIDADRMDYLLRDSYFSGVKYGIYDYGRLLMSFIPIKKGDSVYLAYKESGMDSILEFTNARSSLYSQVYFHKTNRALSAMLNKACGIAKLQNVIKLNNGNTIIEKMENFYVNNSDQKFLDGLLKKTERTSACNIIRDVINRNVWKKIYERKHTFSNVSLCGDGNDKYSKNLDEHKDNLSKEMECIFKNKINEEKWVLDFKIEDNFKDIKKSEALILKKDPSNKYIEFNLSKYNKALQPYHHIKFFIRVFVHPEVKVELKSKDELDSLNKQIEDTVASQISKFQKTLKL